MAPTAPVSSLLALASSDVANPIDPEALLPALTSRPFVHLPGSFNARDLGLAELSSIRAGYIFRSGAIDSLTPEGQAALRDKYAIKRVFDLRSPEERTAAPDPEISGVENTWVQSKAPDTELDLRDFVKDGGEEGYEKMYLEVLDFYRPSWKAVLEHVRDRPRDPLLFHCTAGRDRTGVLAGLLMTLAGTPSAAVTLDYLLTRIGTEPAREKLLAFAMKGTGVESKETPGFYNLCSLRASSWDRFVQGVERVHGGFEEFVGKELGFEKGDIEKIKQNLASETGAY